MRESLVTVIVPNYNHHLYLEERIESIINQEYQNIELILLDDCSPDNSVEILERYRSCPKVAHICVNTQNSGSTFKQWEKGIRMAEGEYIWIAESDDSADPKLLASAMRYFSENPSAVLAFCNSRLIDSNGDSLGHRDQDDYSDTAYTLHDGMDFIRTKMLCHNRIYNASSVVFKKSVWEQVDLDFMNYRYCGDWMFWIEVLRQGDVIWIHERYNRFRKHLNKVSPKADRDGINFMEMRKLLHYLSVRFQLSKPQIASIVGNVFINLLMNESISPVARKREIAAWVKEYPAIFLYSLYRAIQLIPRRILSKFGIVRKYKYPFILKSR